MNRTLLPGVVLWLALAAPSLARAASEAPVEAFHAVLIEAMKAGSSLDFGGRSALIAPVIDGAFDLATIARVVMGDHAGALDEATRRALTERLRGFAVASLAARFTAYEGERFERGETTDVEGGAKRVRARFVKSDGDAVQLDYLVRERADGWRIVNVWFGGVSQSRIQRDEFATFLRDGRSADLLKRLDDRIANLAGR